MSGDLNIAIKWSEPAKVVTKYGPRWVRSWVIPEIWVEGFFVFWNKNKGLLKLKGYGIGKDRMGRWTMSEWQLHKADLRESFGKDNVEKGFDEKLIITESTLPAYKVKDVSGLRDWQVPSVARLCSALKHNRAAIDGSDTGTGKTYVACAVARELELKIAVVCPKSVISSWKKIITKHFGMRPVFILNYESVKTGKYKNIGTWKAVSRISTREYFEWNVPKDTLIIFDESHRLKGHGTQNSEIAIQAKKQKYHILCLSATNSISPIELKTTGFILNLYKKGYTEFLRSHDCEKGRFGWEFGGNKKVLQKLHGDLFLERGVRINKEDIEGFPECENIAESYDIDETSEAELKEIYKEMNKELNLLRLKCKNAKEYQMNAMVLQLRARQKSELLKLPLMVEMIEDSVADGMSVAVFVNFTETLKALSKRLHTTCLVYGENKNQEREKNIEDFQSDKERVILLNIAAGGVGVSLHDLNGTYPRIALISPPLSAVLLVQSMGRIHREGAKSKAINKLLYVANTEEELVCEKLKLKLNNLSLINDGDLTCASTFEEKEK